MKYLDFKYKNNETEFKQIKAFSLIYNTLKIMITIGIPADLIGDIVIIVHPSHQSLYDYLQPSEKKSGYEYIFDLLNR